jgi:nucleoside phosphorylase
VILIEQIVIEAEQHGRIPDLLEYVEKNNSYQYRSFAVRLIKPSPKPASPISDLDGWRLRSIVGHIEQELKLLNEYREQLRYESDPRRIAGIEANIERQKQSLRHYQQEAAALGGDIDLPKLVETPPKPTVEEAVDEEKLEYATEDQLWFPAHFPVLDELPPDQLERFQKEIDVVLMVATEVEIRAALHLLQPYPRRKHILRAFVGAETYYLGKFGAYRTAVTRCGMGAGGERGSTLATPEALRTWQPKAIIMPGIAFGEDPGKQKMADVLVASQIIPYEKQRRGEKTIFRDPIPPSNALLQNRFENALDWRFDRPDGRPCKLRIGPILSGEKLVDDLKFKAELFAHFPEAIGGEMEGAGVAAAAGRMRVPWILVKAICDWGDGKKHGKHQPLAAAAAVSLVHHVLSHKSVLPDR